MKFRFYTVRRQGHTCLIFGGRAVDFDLQGGLEEIMEEELERGARRILLILRGMKFLHATLLAGLLNIQLKLERRQGTLELVEPPWFLPRIMNRWKIADRFIWHPQLPVELVHLLAASSSETGGSDGFAADIERLRGIIG